MPPVIIGAGIAAAGAVGAAAIGSHATKQAAKTTQQGTDQSLAVQQQIYGQNAAALSPYEARGNAAGNEINALLGLGGGPSYGTQGLPTQQPAQPISAYGGAYGGTPNALTAAKMNQLFPGWGTGPNAGPAYLQYQQAVNTAGSAPAQQPVSQTPAQAAMNAFDIFRNSDGYQFRLNQGLNAVNSGYAGAGTIQSGAAMKAINDYGQNMASNEFGNYMGYLGNQQGVGLSAASAQAGVGQNYANNVSNLNTANANALAQLQLARGNNTASLVGGLGAIGANVAGSILAPTPSTYGVIQNNGSAFAGYY